MRTASLRTLTLALGGIACLSLAACGDKSEDGDGSSDTASQESDGGSGSDDGGSGSGGDSGDDGDGGDGGSGSGDDSGDTGSDPIQSSCETGEDGEQVSLPAIRFSSEVTWTLSFDAEAESKGYTDCSYSRSYDGIQKLGYEFLCPECDFTIRGTATMTDGREDCYETVFGEADPSRIEWWGVAGDALHRTGADQAPMGELTTFTGESGDGEVVDVSWDSEYDLTDGGTMTLAASGTMSWSDDEDTLLEDPWGPREEPYACGWECNDPGDLDFDYDLEPGDTMPNVRLEDQCGEMVDLWDFYGSYVVLDTSQFDCGPCRSMAESEEEFLQQMREADIPVRVLTMMGDGLGNPYGTPDADTVNWWIEEYGLTDPVLYDRGYAYALFPGFIEDTTGEDFGYPAWLVLDPQMRIISGNVGFSSWDAVTDVIEGDLDR